jgi:protein tyrosine/serine phosphatase
MKTWVQWAREGVLARSPRPGFTSGAEFSVRRDAVEEWITHTRALGIASIICLLDRDQLPLYERAMPGGLLARYAEAGFAVAHIPTPDGQTHPFTQEQYHAAWAAFTALPKPVLVHCSAGVDRTGRIVSYILQQLEND